MSSISISSVCENPATISGVLENLLNSFLNPGFGSITKAELELVYFKALQDLGYITKTPQAYELVTKLHVSRQKARNLLYNSSLRVFDENSLEQQIKQLLMKREIILEGDKVCIEVYNPFLIDYLKAKMTEHKLGISDASFSPELVRIPIESYGELYTKYASEEAKEIKRFLRKLGVPTSSCSLGTALKWFMKSIGSKLLDDEGKEIATQLYDKIRDVIAGTQADKVLDADLILSCKKLFGSIKK